MGSAQGQSLRLLFQSLRGLLLGDPQAGADCYPRVLELVLGDPQAGADCYPSVLELVRDPQAVPTATLVYLE